MIPLKNIREDLKAIRYYYNRKEILDRAGSRILKPMQDKVDKYSNAISFAPPHLIDLYVCLYTLGFTQETLSIELNLSPEYVQMQHKKLLLFLQAKFDENETNESEDDEE